MLKATARALEKPYAFTQRAYNKATYFTEQILALVHHGIMQKDPTREAEEPTE